MAAPRNHIKVFVSSTVYDFEWQLDTDATCYESETMYPTDPKLLWEGIEMYRQQKNHFERGDCRESIPDRIVSISKPYVRPIVRGK